MVNIICLYLPQFHRIKENDLWWGEGYTDWVAVKNAKQLYRNHLQPRIPLNNNYYDLNDKSALTWLWQAEIAQEHGIYGFCIYHYWFTGRKLLEKPMEILLAHNEINIHYCICWANHTWQRNWYGTNKEVLVEQKYGNESDWIIHFQYLLPFFKDDRYIKIDNKPVVNIYDVNSIATCLSDMKECWDKLAKENGFTGVYFVGNNILDKNLPDNTNLDAYYNFEPNRAIGLKRNKVYYKIFIWWKAKLIRFLSRIAKKKLFENKRSLKRVYHLILSEKFYSNKKIFPGLFPEYDDTPRRQEEGIVYTGASPKLFEKALYQLLKKADRMKSDFVYINAWNEWGETAYLEPDKKNGYAYLEAVKRALEKYKKEAQK